MLQSRFYTFVALLIASSWVAIVFQPLFFILSFILLVFLLIATGIDQDFNNRIK
jgi:hypothetical protein